MTSSILGKTGLEVSRIGLGTVEIGVADYGVGQKGLVSEPDAIHLLKTAVDLGVTYIDTARGYGLAEERIGKSGIAQKDGVTVGTKCAQWLREQPDLHGLELEKRIRQDIDLSRRLLGLTSLPLVQLHIELPDYTNLDELIDIMSKLKSEQKIIHMGIAVRGEEVPLSAIKSGFFDSIQLAYSILDQRMAARVLPGAHDAGVGIINRSVLLKGTLTPARKNLPDSLAPLKENADKAEAIAGEMGISLPDLAIRFCLADPAVSTVLIGTTKPHRLASALAAADSEPLPEDIIQRLHTLAITDPNQVDPGRWPK